MKSFLKILFVGFCISLQTSMAFGEGIYIANSPEKSTLFIKAPSASNIFTNVYTFTNPDSIWNPGMLLVYGIELFKNQLNNPIHINANQPFVFAINLAQRNTNCQIARSFTPQANQIYGLIVGFKAPTSHQTFAENLMKGVDSGKCYIAVIKIEKNGFIPIKLQSNYSNLAVLAHK